MNCVNAIKLKLITVNGIIINNAKFSVNIKDLVQKRRTKKKNKFPVYMRLKRLK